MTIKLARSSDTSLIEISCKMTLMQNVSIIKEYSFEFANYANFSLSSLYFKAKAYTVINTNDIRYNAFLLIKSESLINSINGNKMNPLAVIIPSSLSYFLHQMKTIKVFILPEEDFRKIYSLLEYSPADTDYYLFVQFNIQPTKYYLINYFIYCPLSIGIICIAFLVVYCIKYYLIPHKCKMDIHISLIKVFISLFITCVIMHLEAEIDKLSKYFDHYGLIRIIIAILSSLMLSILKCSFYVYTLLLLSGWQILFFKEKEDKLITRLLISFFFIDFTIGSALYLFINPSNLLYKYDFTEVFNCLEAFLITIVYIIHYVGPRKFISGQLNYAQTVDERFCAAFIRKDMVLFGTLVISLIYTLGYIFIISVSRFCANNYLNYEYSLLTKVNCLALEVFCLIILSILHFPQILPKGYYIHIDISDNNSNIYQCILPSYKNYDNLPYGLSLNPQKIDLFSKRNHNHPFMIINPGFNNSGEYKGVYLGYIVSK